MALGDYMESEVAIAAAAAAAKRSPRVRGVLRKGAVYGLTGVLVVGDAVGSFARGVGRSTQNAASTTADATENAVVATADPAGSAAGATPATPEAAADELAAVVQGKTDGTTTTGRRSRRPHVEQAEGALNE